MQVTHYLIKYRESIYPVFELEGEHKLASPYMLKLRVGRNLSAAMLLGEKVLLGYDKTTSNLSKSTDIKIKPLYCALVCRVESKALYNWLWLQPAWSWLSQCELAKPGNFTTIKHILSYAISKVGYTAEEKRFNFTNKKIILPRAACLSTNSLALYQRICFEAALSYNFQIEYSGPGGLATEKIIFFDSSLESQSAATCYEHKRGDIFVNNSPPLSSYLSRMSYCANSSPTSMQIWRADKWQENLQLCIKLHDNLSAKKNAGVAMGSVTPENNSAAEMIKQPLSKYKSAKELLPPSCLTDIKTADYADLLLGRYHQEAEALNFFHFGEPHYPGDIIEFTGSGMTFSPQGRYRVTEVKFATFNAVVRQTISLQLLSKPYIPPLADLYAGQSFLWRHYLIEKNVTPNNTPLSASPINDLGRYYCHPKLLAKESKAQMISNVPCRQLWVSPPAASSEKKKTGCSIAFACGEAVALSYVYGCLQAPLILDSLNNLACAKPSLLAAASWRLQGAWRQGFSLSLHHAGFNVYTLNKAPFFNRFMLSKGVSKKSVANGNEENSALRTNKLQIISDAQSINYTISQNIFSNVYTDAVWRHNFVHIKSKVNLVLRTNDKLQTQSKNNIKINASEALRLVASGGFHLHAKKKIDLGAKSAIDVSAKQARLHGKEVAFSSANVEIKASGGGINLAVGSSVIMLKPGMISIFSPSISMPAGTAYLGAVSRMPTAPPVQPGVCIPRPLIAKTIAAIIPRQLLRCSDLRWQENFFYVDDQVTLSFKTFLQLSGEGSSPVEFKLGIYIVRQADYMDNFKKRKKVLLQSMSRKGFAGHKNHQIKFDLRSIDLQKKAASLDGASSAGNLFILFNIDYAGQTWWVRRPALLLWDICLRVYQWASGKSMQLSPAAKLQYYPQLHSDSAFSCGPIWGDAEAINLLSPYAASFSSHNYALQYLPFINTEAVVYGATECFPAANKQKWNKLSDASVYQMPADLIKNSKSAASKNDNASKDSTSVADKKTKKYRLDLHLLAPPVIVHLPEVELDSLAKPVFKHNSFLSDEDLSRLKLAGDEITLFIHGYDVPFGDFSSYEDTSSAAARQRKPIDINSGSNNNIPKAEVFSSVERTVLDPKREDTTISKSTKPSAPVATGAHKWLQSVEYYLNKANGFSATDYRDYRRVVLIAWHSLPKSIFGYAKSVTQAEYAGIQLAAILAQLNDNGFKISIVAHSLGCGVALVAANEFYDRYSLKVGRIILCEPALPFDVLSQGFPDNLLQLGDGNNTPLDNSIKRNFENSLVDKSNISPWFLPSLWSGVDKISVLFSRNDNVLGPIRLALVDTAGTKVLDEKPVATEVVLPMFLQCLGLEDVYSVGAATAVPVDKLLQEETSNSLYDQFVNAKPDKNNFPATLDQYTLMLKDRGMVAIDKIKWRDASLALQQKSIYALANGRWRGDAPSDSHWQQLTKQLLDKLTLLVSSRVTPLERIVALQYMLRGKSYYPAQAALGYHGPNTRDPMIQILSDKGSLEWLDTTSWVWSHSHMLRPNTAVLNNVYKYMTSRLPQFSASMQN